MEKVMLMEIKENKPIITNLVNINMLKIKILNSLNSEFPVWSEDSPPVTPIVISLNLETFTEKSLTKNKEINLLKVLVDILKTPTEMFKKDKLKSSLNVMLN